MTEQHKPQKRDRVHLRIEYGRDGKAHFEEQIILEEGTIHTSTFNQQEYIKFEISKVERDIE